MIVIQRSTRMVINKKKNIGWACRIHLDKIFSMSTYFHEIINNIYLEMIGSTVLTLLPMNLNIKTLNNSKMAV